MTTRTLLVRTVNENKEKIHNKIDDSKGKTCGICLEKVLEKTDDNRFGILSDCRHCFCWTCIKTWRRICSSYVNVTKSCPECRICSNYVYPSNYWIDVKTEKDMLFSRYKAIIKTDCKISRCFRSCLLEDECQYYNIKCNLENSVSVLAFYVVLVLLTIVT